MGTHCLVWIDEVGVFDGLMELEEGDARLET